MNDYLEFKEHLEHAFTQKDKAKEYEERGKKEANLKERRYKDTIREKVLSLAKTSLEYYNTYANTFEHNLGINPRSSYGGQQTAITEAKKTREKANKQFNSTLNSLVALMNKYPDAFFNDEKRYLKLIEDENGFNRQEIVKNLIDSLQVQHFSWDRKTASHSNLEHASKSGIPTNLKQESSNIKRASERAKFMNQLQQIWNRLTVLDQQIVRLRRDNLRTRESKKRDLPDGGTEIVTNYKSGGSHSAVTELTKAWDKYEKEEQQLSKKAYNLINMGKNDPMFTRLEQEKMKLLIKNADDVDTNGIRDLIEFIFSHSELDNYLAHASDAFNRKRKDLPVSGMPTSAAAKAGFKGTTGAINNHVSTAEKTASRRVYDPDTGEFKDSGTSITDKMIQNADRQQIINRATAMNNTTNKVLQSVQNNNQLGQLKELKSMIATYNQKYGAKLRLKEHSVVSAGWDNKLFTMEVTG